MKVNAPPNHGALGDDLFKQVVELYVLPELAKRGTPSAQVRAAQVVMTVGQPVQVRLNDEVRAVLRAVAARPIAKGENVAPRDLRTVEDIALTDDDPNSAHVTMVQLEGGWSIAFDFRYNRAEVARHLGAAAEFLAAADDACKREHHHSFVDTLFSATELTAKAELLMLPDPALLGAKSHKFLGQRFNQRWRNHSAVQAEVALLNRLSQLRYPARYLRSDLNMTSADAVQMLQTATAFHARVTAQAPKMDPSSP
jgi:uncharacterized protein (UPF0332 family)